MRLGELIAPFNKRNKNVLCTDVYSVTNSRGFTPSEDYFSKEVFSKDLKTYRIVKHGMIAYNPSRINVGSIALQNKLPEVVVSPLYVVFKTDESRLLPDYVLGFLKSKPGLDQIAFQSIGTVRNNLKYDALCRIVIDLPSLEQQQLRVNRLTCISEIIELLNRYQSRLDTLVKSRFVEMFGEQAGGRIASLRDCCSSIRGGKTPSMKHPEYYGGTVPFIKSGDVKDDSVSSGTLWLSDVALEKAGVTLIPKDSVLVVVRSALLQRKVCAAVCAEDVAINQDIKAFVPKKEFSAIYLLWAIRSHEQRLLAGVRSVSTSALDYGDLCCLPIKVAPLSLQQRFADFVAQVDKSRFVATQGVESIMGLSECDTLFNT